MWQCIIVFAHNTILTAKYKPLIQNIFASLSVHTLVRYKTTWKLWCAERKGNYSSGCNAGLSMGDPGSRYYIDGMPPDVMMMANRAEEMMRKSSGVWPQPGVDQNWAVLHSVWPPHDPSWLVVLENGKLGSSWSKTSVPVRYTETENIYIHNHISDIINWKCVFMYSYWSVKGIAFCCFYVLQDERNTLDLLADFTVVKTQQYNIVCIFMLNQQTK